MNQHPASPEANQALNDLTDFYMLLDIKPDASPADIREAYLRAKATYQKDNLALYTLIDSTDREDMLRRIEEAYHVLSNVERRKEYDRFYGQIATGSPFGGSIESAKIISIDRNPPMENTPVGKNPLSAPRTDHSQPGIFNPHYAGGMDLEKRTPSAFQEPEEKAAVRNEMPAHSSAASSSSSPKILAEDIEREIREQTEWTGAFLRRVREARGVSIEEVTQATRITKIYIIAIEEENFAKLPAAVFIRGFVAQLARLLKLPHAQVTASYMARLQSLNPEKFR